MKYQFRFVEINHRLGMSKHRTKTLELDPELFKHYDVDGMVKAFMLRSYGFTFNDSTLYIKSIKVGNRIFKDVN